MKYSFQATVDGHTLAFAPMLREQIIKQISDFYVQKIIPTRAFTKLTDFVNKTADKRIDCAAYVKDGVEATMELVEADIRYILETRRFGRKRAKRES